MNIRGILRALVILLGAAVVAPAQGTSLTLFGAGRLRVPLEQIAAEYLKRTGVRMEPAFGPSGLMRERIEGGERPDIFASADMDSPGKLAKQGLGMPVHAFTANAVCAVVRRGLHVAASSLLKVMLDPAVRIGAAEPVADPLGDYMETIFAKGDELQAGAKKTLDGKAIRLIGSRNAPRVPAGQESNAYFLMTGKQVDLMISYCSGAQAAVRAEPRLQVVQLPPELAVAANYGHTVIKGAKKEATAFGRFLESEAAQKIFLDNGFVALQ